MNQKEPSLDQLLSEMADNVPPMPADFHDHWVNAVRAEAEHAEEPVHSSVSQWPRILSIAAVFIFLIGGTFIYRSTRNTIMTESRPVNAMPVPEATVTAEAYMEEAMPEGADMENGTGNMLFEAADSEGGADYSVDAAPDSEVSALKNPDLAAEKVSAAGALMLDAAEEAARYETEAEAPATGMPAPTASISVTEVPAAEIPMAGTPEAVPSERRGVSGFFTDMGDFLLTVWPYLLIASVPLAVAAGVKKLRKKW